MNHLYEPSRDCALLDAVNRRPPRALRLVTRRDDDGVRRLARYLDRNCSTLDSASQCRAILVLCCMPLDGTLPHKTTPLSPPFDLDDFYFYISISGNIWTRGCAGFQYQGLNAVQFEASVLEPLSSHRLLFSACNYNCTVSVPVRLRASSLSLGQGGTAAHVLLARPPPGPAQWCCLGPSHWGGRGLVVEVY